MKKYRLPDPYVPGLTIESLGANTGGVVVSATWPTADLGIIVPVVFPVSCTLYSMSARGNNTTGNYDLAFYNENYVRLAAKGSTAMAAATLTLTLPELRVQAGRLYYGAMAMSSASGTVYRAPTGDTAIRFNVLTGLAQQASALPLPDPFVPATITVDCMPFFVFGVR